MQTYCRCRSMRAKKKFLGVFPLYICQKEEKKGQKGEKGQRDLKRDKKTNEKEVCHRRSRHHRKEACMSNQRYSRAGNQSP